MVNTETFTSKITYNLQGTARRNCNSGQKTILSSAGCR